MKNTEGLTFSEQKKIQGYEEKQKEFELNLMRRNLHKSYMN